MAKGLIANEQKPKKKLPVITKKRNSNGKGPLGFSESHKKYLRETRNDSLSNASESVIDFNEEEYSLSDKDMSKRIDHIMKRPTFMSK